MNLDYFKKNVPAFTALSLLQYSRKHDTSPPEENFEGKNCIKQAYLEYEEEQNILNKRKYNLKKIRTKFIRNSGSKDKISKSPKKINLYLYQNVISSILNISVRTFFKYTNYELSRNRLTKDKSKLHNTISIAGPIFGTRSGRDIKIEYISKRLCSIVTNNYIYNEDSFCAFPFDKMYNQQCNCLNIGWFIASTGNIGRLAKSLENYIINSNIPNVLILVLDVEKSTIAHPILEIFSANGAEINTMDYTYIYNVML